MQTQSPPASPANRGATPRAPYARPALEALGAWSARTLQVTGFAATPAEMIERDRW